MPNNKISPDLFSVKGDVRRRSAAPRPSLVALVTARLKAYQFDRQLDRIDQRLNKHQRPGRGFRLVITGPLHRSRVHPLSLPARDRYINLTSHA